MRMRSKKVRGFSRRPGKRPTKEVKRDSVRVRVRFSPVTRIGYSTHTFAIPNVSAKEAQRIALEQAGDHEFSEKHSEYEVQSIYRKPS